MTIPVVTGRPTQQGCDGCDDTLPTLVAAFFKVNGDRFFSMATRCAKGDRLRRQAEAFWP